jgi:hypothetical protein
MWLLVPYEGEKVMSTLAQSVGDINKPWKWIAAGGAVLLIWGALALPRWNSAGLEKSLPMQTEPMAERNVPPRSASHSVALFQDSTAMKAEAIAGTGAPSAPAERKIVRTGSLELMVQHPEEVMDKITALANGWGGYLESSEGGGQNATTGTLTIRVPAARFEEARAAIRKLGLRVQSEKINAEDVTKQYVDQDASLRNLRAEEA